MQRLDQKKIKRMAHIFRIVMQVFFWVSIVMVVVCAIGALKIYFSPQQDFIGFDQFKLSIDSVVSYEVDPQTDMNVSVKSILLSISLMTGILFVGFAFLLRQLRDLLRTVEEENPFAKENAKRITVMGVIFLIGSIVYKAAGGVVALAIIHTYNLTNFEVNFSPDIFMVFTGFMLLILAGIFQYGSFLQEEYDTTL